MYEMEALGYVVLPAEMPPWWGLLIIGAVTAVLMIFAYWMVNR